MATSEELQAQINSLLATINSLSEQLRDESGYEDPVLLKEENIQIQKHLNDFITKEGILLTIASLFGFSSFSNENISTYFPIFTLSFLIFAIISYILSSKRFHIIQSIRASSNLKILSPKEINNILKKSYFRTLKYHSITDALIVAYFVSFTLNYYLNFYCGSLDLKTSIVVWFSAVSLGLWRYLSVKDKKEINGVIATGGPSFSDGVMAFGGVVEPTQPYTPENNPPKAEASEIPENFSVMNDDFWSKVTPFNQRNIPACVAHTTATMMQQAWYKKTGKIINFSPRFLDIISWTDDLGINDGRHPDVVMDLSVKVGCCTEDLLPNDTTLPIEKYRDKSLITDAMYKEAEKYKLENLGLTFKSLW